MRNVALIIFVFFSTIVSAQNFNITGKVFTPQNTPIEDATITLMKAKDSSVVNFTSTSKEGFFDLQLNKISEPTLFKITADDYLEFTQRFESIEKSRNLGNIQLKKDTVVQIEGIVLQVSTPIRIKKDTIEYNAASFNVRPDGKAEDLLKVLPGFEIDNDGKITANGREVDKILVNGKPFFDEDGKIVMKNFPADVIKKIQLTTTSTKEEELSGEKPKSQNQTVNITIDEKKNKGYMARLSAGYGTDNHYESSAFATYFKDKTKVILIGSANNINSSGFSNDEVFGSMGSGRNRNQFGVSGASNGLQESYTLGLNYSDQFGKQIDLEKMGLRTNGSNIETKSAVDRTTFLPDYSLQTKSKNSGINDRNSYSFDTGLRINIDSLTSVYFAPSISTTNFTNESNGESETYRDGTLVNGVTSSSKSSSNQNDFSSRLVFSKRFKKLRRSLTLSMNTQISNGTTDDFILSETTFYQNPAENDYRNQLLNDKKNNTNFSFNIDYVEPVSDSAKIGIQMNYRSSDDFSRRLVNDFDNTLEEYSLYNEKLSNQVLQKKDEFIPGLSYRWEKEKIDLRLYSRLGITKLDFDSHFNSTDYKLDKNFILPQYEATFVYKFSRNKRLMISHNANFSTPSAMQLIPYEDDTNPLISQTGNPLLKNTWNNSTNLSFSNFNQQKNINYFFRANYSFQRNSVVSKRFFDNNGKQFISYENINGNYAANAGGGINKTFRWNNNRLRIGTNINGSLTKRNGFIDGDIYSSKNYNASLRFNIYYELRDRMVIKPSFQINHSFSNYENYKISSTKTTYNRFTLETTNYFGPDKNLVFGNDFSYNTNSNIAPGLKKDFYNWNMSLGYNFFKKQMSARIMVYDLLNQNQSVRRTIADTYVEDREDLILKRYFMFTLSYNFNHFSS